MWGIVRRITEFERLQRLLPPCLPVASNTGLPSGDNRSYRVCFDKDCYVSAWVQSKMDRKEGAIEIEAAV